MILVTGATGFIGRQILKQLALGNNSVRIIARPNSRNKLEPTSKWEFVETRDLFNEDMKWWQQVLENVDTVIHLAWYTEPGQYQQSEKNIECLMGTLRLAKACVNSGTRRFVGIGTCAEYDLFHGKLSINTPLEPTTLYSACKASTFLTLSQLFKENKVEFSWCRLFYLFGDGEDPRRLVANLRKKLSTGQRVKLTTGNQVRDFLDVKDAGRWITEIALGDQQGPVNICSGVAITVKQMAEKLADEYGRRDLLEFGSRSENILDPPFVVGVKGDTLR